ncbi:DUF4367 domain-containing protein [Niameybacter massiliensis]|uniref:DUF4367 domain-containing protein n=1 Tax=Holtiella tumoricola TaxID=3018743 RepID=A0AA42DR38_9FIRM|nr:DUF4367 domain-containing protein [Holtiella tumoricola]MDA3733552.1 DUF4367 domain-containing protein [Holtiella tumoricola]
MDEIDDLDMIKAAREAETIIVEQLENKDKEDHRFTEAFEEKIYTLIKSEKCNKSSGLARKIGIAILIVSIVGSLSMSVEAVRVRVIELITDVFEKFTSISYQKHEGKYGGDIQESYLPQYLPEGFEMTDQEQIFNDVHITYQNKLGEEILLRQIEINTNNMIIDTEGTTIEKLILEDREIYYYENKGIKNLMWIQEGYQFMLSSEIEKRELIKVSLSIK